MLYDYAKLIKEYREITVCRWETGKFEPNMATKKKLISLFKETGMKIDD